MPKLYVELLSGLRIEWKVVVFCLEVISACTTNPGETGFGAPATFRKIAAIKLIRAYPDLSLGLKEAKDLVEFVYENKGLLTEMSRAPYKAVFD